MDRIYNKKIKKFSTQLKLQTGCYNVYILIAIHGITFDAAHTLLVC